MNEVVLIDAVRTPFGRRGGSLSNSHSVEVLGDLMSQLLCRAQVEPAAVGQVLGGCVLQMGMQGLNVTRQAWLSAGLPEVVPGCTIDAQCGSSQQASTLAVGLIASGTIDVAVACGVELMSRVPMGSTTPKQGSVGKPVTKRYWDHHDYTTQFEAAERIADKWQLTRSDCDQFAKESQDRAANAQIKNRFVTQLIPVEVPNLDEHGKADGSHEFAQDEGIRETTLEGLARLSPVARPDGVHTAGSASQISDGSSAVLLMSREKANQLGIVPMASIVASCLVGCDPTLMLTGPIVATRKLFAENGFVMGDMDLVEINEAFASVVLAWERELKPDMEKVNPNGGAIALGHPLGATGTALLAKAAHELQRTDKELALVTMCCGGGLGTGTILRRA
jgi:acetyl-CoA C-acetyltransferase